MDHFPQSLARKIASQGQHPLPPITAVVFFKERAVAGRTVGNAFSGKPALAWDPKLVVVRAGSDDDRFRVSSPFWQTT